MTLPRGEDVVEHYTRWDKEGRIPQWSILVSFEGRPGIPKICRLRAAVLGAVVPGLVDDVVPRSELERWDRRAAVSVKGSNESYVILSPKGATT